MGIRTVFNLRGVNKASPYLFEKEACDKVGLTLVTQRLQARSLPAREVLLELLDMLETIQHPFVMHCKSGADRAGLAAACYMLHVRGVPIKEAKKQLSVKFLHLKSFQTGILDHMLVAYETDTAEKPMAFRKWIETRYDNKRLTATFNADRGKT